jgi:single-strand DNA-binding protein
MNCLNNLIIEGNFTGDSREENLSNGNKRLIFSIGVERNVKDEAGEIVVETSCFDIAVYGHLADICASKIKAGKGLRVVGRLKQDNIIIADDKVANYVYIIAEHIEFKK